MSIITVLFQPMSLSVSDNTVRIGAQTFAYLSAGKPSDPCVLMLHGLGAQAAVWPEPLILRLAKAGYFVVAPDNRDIGRASKWHDHAVPNQVLAWLRYQLGLSVPASYRLEDMAADHWRLLDHLGKKSVRVVGASMGGMIAQCMAANTPHRVDHLALLMTNNGHPKYMRPRLRLMHKMATINRSADPFRAKFALIKMLRAQTDENDDAELVDRLNRCDSRSTDDTGRNRQMAAIFASGNRSGELCRITAPTLIVHGERDPLIPVAAGRELAEQISNSTLKVVRRMGHDITDRLSPKLSKKLVKHFRNTVQTAAKPRSEANIGALDYGLT